MKPIFKDPTLESAYEEFNRTGDYTSIRELYRKYVQQANKQLRALEQAGRDYYAYDIAVSSASEFGKAGRKRRRFSLQPESGKEVADVLMAVDKFLASKSSTVKGQIDIEQQRLATFRAKYKVLQDVDDDELIDFFRSFSADEVEATSVNHKTSDDEAEANIAVFMSLRKEAHDNGRRLTLDDIRAEFTPFYEGKEQLYQLYDRHGYDWIHKQ